MWHTYILLCKNKSYYVGNTNNLKRRFQEHLQGKGGNYTKVYPPIKIVYKESYPEKFMAVKRELQIKKWSRAKKDALINKNFVALKNLSVSQK